MRTYADSLRQGTHKIAVWGAGYIGFSTLAYFARSGVSGLAIDVMPERVAAINRGDLEVVGLADWLGFDVKPLTQRGFIRATIDAREALRPEVLVHFICIPTEKDGRPYDRYLEEVVTTLAGLPAADSDRPPLVIIESTLTPGTTERVVIPLFEKLGKRVGKDLLLGVAPRRDWFVDNTKSLKELDRVFGGHDARATQATGDVLRIVCDRLHAASSHRTSEMVKSFENAYRHMEITLANQLSLAYPQENVREVLRLVGTKWNIGTFYPGFGVGGYCIPLSSQYVIGGAERPEALSILSETIRTDTAINHVIARAVVNRGLKRVGVLGLAYKADLKVSILSPTIPFLRRLVDEGVEVKLYDPFYSAEEIRQLAGVSTFEFPQGLAEFDAVVAVVDHSVFRQSAASVLAALNHCRFVLDNQAMWTAHANAFRKRGIEYHVSGDAGWLGQPAESLALA